MRTVYHYSIILELIHCFWSCIYEHRDGHNVRPLYFCIYQNIGYLHRHLPCNFGEIMQDRLCPISEDFNYAAKANLFATLSLRLEFAFFAVNEYFILGTLIEWWLSYILGYSYQHQHIPISYDDNHFPL